MEREFEAFFQKKFEISGNGKTVSEDTYLVKLQKQTEGGRFIVQLDHVREFDSSLAQRILTDPGVALKALSVAAESLLRKPCSFCCLLYTSPSPRDS